ncbi:MAG: DUF86 domain-containing protein [Nitrospira sp.]|nr:DUF86 domain-containing protein [Nitrospira sp.]
MSVSQRMTRCGVRSCAAWKLSKIIGDAVKNLPDEFRASHPEGEWRPIAQMRDRLFHGYFGVDYQLVGDMVCEKLPELKRSIQRIIDSQQA